MVHLYKRLEASHIGHLTIRCHYACERSTYGDDHRHQIAKGRPAHKKPRRRALRRARAARSWKKICRWICFFLLCAYTNDKGKQMRPTRLRALRPNAAVSKSTRTTTSFNNNGKGRSTQFLTDKGSKQKKVERNCSEQCRGSGRNQ